MRLEFPIAPWPTSLKVISALGTVAVIAIGYAAYQAMPKVTGLAHSFGLVVAAVPFVLLLWSYALSVRGYAVEGDELQVRRLATVTRVPLAGITRAYPDPGICKGSIRVVGNGGLFSYSGIFYNKKIGRFRLFATNFAHSVVLVMPQRVVVLTPDNPHALIEHLRQRHPGMALTAAHDAG